MNISQENKQKGQELLQKLVSKAWESATFKEQLIQNPEGAIESITGEKIMSTDHNKIIVEDQTDSSVIYLNIPRKFDSDDLELTDEQLEAVSGGDIGTVLAVIAVASILYSAGKGIYDAVTE